MARTKNRKAASPKRPAARKRSMLARVAASNGAHDPLREVEQFLYRQAELLDGKRWSDFITLFADDGVYWMPASPEQTTADGMPAIFYEDRNLMTVRMKRLAHPHAWSQAPIWGTSHLVSNVAIEEVNRRTGDMMVRSRFHMMEFRRDSVRHFAGSYRHQLHKTGNGYRIKLQRVDMVNGEGPYDYVLQVWV
jgi:benzoate/toluate 1,2-dioxygenase beta subunit